jgi:hypothetical protein
MIRREEICVAANWLAVQQYGYEAALGIRISMDEYVFVRSRQIIVEMEKAASKVDEGTKLGMSVPCAPVERGDLSPVRATVHVTSGRCLGYRPGDFRPSLIWPPEEEDRLRKKWAKPKS